MKLIQIQISEILSNYTSSNKAFPTLQYLIFNFLLSLERDLFISKNEHEQW